MSNEEIDMSGLAVQTPEGALIAKITVFENQALASEATGKSCTSIMDQLRVVKGYGDYVPDLSTASGDKEARQARALCVSCRTGAKKVRMLVKEKWLTPIEKSLMRMEGDIEQQVREIEEPIDAAIKLEEDRKEQEKEAKRQAEAIRVQKIQDMLSVLRGWPNSMIGSTSAEIQDKIARCEKSVIKEEVFQEFVKDAQAAKSASIAQLQQLLASTLEQEVKTKELEAAKAEQDAKDSRIAELEAMLASAGLSPEDTQAISAGVQEVCAEIQTEAEDAEASALFDDEPPVVDVDNPGPSVPEAEAATDELMSAVEDAMAYHDAIVEILAMAQNTTAMPNHMKFRAYVTAKCKEVLEG
jgi:hypothetical protein